MLSVKEERAQNGGKDGGQETWILDPGLTPTHGPLGIEAPRPAPRNERSGPDGPGDLAFKRFWRSEDGTCPVLFHLGRGFSPECGSRRGSIALSKTVGLVHQVTMFLGLKG